VIRFDPNGNILWDRIFGSARDEEPVQIKETAEGGFGIFARFYDGPAAEGSVTNYGHGDWLFIRLDANGTKLWEESFGGSAYDLPGSFEITSDGGFILVGSSQSPASGNKTSPGYGSGDPLWGTADVWVVRLGANGTKLWDRSFGGAAQEA